MPNELSNDKLLYTLYYDLEKGYGSVSNLYKQAKAERNDISLNEVKEWMQKQTIKQRKAYKGKGNSYVANFPRDQFQMDIADMVELQKTTIDKRYLLVVIDIFSKYGMAIPLTNKSADETFNAIKLVFGKMGFPRSIYTDDGAEFKSKVGQLFTDEGIKHITTLTHAHVVERFIRTLKSGIHDRVRFTKNTWEVMLNHVINKYNNTIHSATGFTPNEAVKDKHSSDIKVQLELKANNRRKYPNIFKLDVVKIYKKAGKYGEHKESKSRWSDEKFKVIDIIYGMNTFYKLDGKQKEYLRHELLLVND